MKKRVLVITWSQTGQLADVVRTFTAPLLANTGIDVVFETLRPVTPYPFPWPFLRFFNTFPETVHEDPAPIHPLQVDSRTHFDLVIIAWQVWFLSPAQPVMAFLQGREAERLLRGRQVISLIACRNMWLMAHAVMQEKLADIGAVLIDNVALVDRAHPAATFISTPLLMLTGHRGPFLGGRVPAAGIADADILAASRFGEAIAAQLPGRDVACKEPMLRGLGAVTINERLIASEKIARRSFLIWGKLLRAIGDQSSVPRLFALVFYILFLVLMILTVVPVTALLKRLLAPFMRARIARQRAAFAAPSGEGCENVKEYPAP
jgi:hypothetical protein